jgi:hypothetical protein
VPVQAATTASPIQVTTAVPHGFTSGNQVFIEGVIGLIGANGLFTVTVTGPCEFILLKSTGAGVYAGGGLVKLQTPLEAFQLAETILDLLPPQYQVKLPDPPTDAQWPRWIMSFCNRLENAFQDKPPAQPIWLLIDTFHAVSLSQSATDLIRELAQRINVNLFSLRLVLLGFEDSMPAEVSNHLAEEVIGPIGEDQIIEAVVAAFEQMQLEQSTEKMEGVLLVVLKDAALADPEFLFKIGTVMTRELQKLESRT